MNKPEVFIFDIDGTLADHHGIRSPFDESKVGEDKPIEPVGKVLRALFLSGYEIIFVSGRSLGCYAATYDWIYQNFPFLLSNIPQTKLLMRGIHDRRGDDIVKKEIYDNFILPYFDIIGVFDDRMRVCRMLYENNIFCFNVNQGLKEF